MLGLDSPSQKQRSTIWRSEDDTLAFASRLATLPGVRDVRVKGAIGVIEVHGFDPRTLAEARRCLRPGGRLIVLPVALPKNRFLDWLYKFTGESPSESEEVVRKKLREPFVKANLETEILTRELQSSKLFIVTARRNHVEKIT